MGGSCERVAGGTFHSFANTVLRRAGRARSGLEPGFTILDRGDAEDVVNLLRSRAGLDRKDRRFPRKNAILEILSMAVNRSMTVPDVIVDGWPHLIDHLDDLVRLGRASTRATSASERWSTTTTCWSCCATSLRDAPETRRAALAARTATSWWTSTRTRTACRRRSSAGSR